MRTFVAILALALGASAFAQDTIDPAKRASIEELLTLAKIDDIAKQFLPLMQQAVASERAIPLELRNKMGQAKVDAELRDYQNRLLDLLRDNVAFDKMKPLYVRAYDETFSAEEIAGILAFYKSPAGQAFLEKTPALTSKIMQLSRSTAMELLPEVSKIHAAWVNELKKKYENSDDAK